MLSYPLREQRDVTATFFWYLQYSPVGRVVRKSFIPVFHFSIILSIGSQEEIVVTELIIWSQPAAMWIVVDLNFLVLWLNMSSSEVYNKQDNCVESQLTLISISYSYSCRKSSNSDLYLLWSCWLCSQEKIIKQEKSQVALFSHLDR